MKRPNRNSCFWLTQSLCAFALAGGLSARAAVLPTDWQHVQHFEVSAPGLVKLSLSVDTLDAARAALEDLRLYDDTGNELSYLIERPTPAGRVIQSAESFTVSLNARTTVVTLETGLAQPLDSVTLESPANSFIKAVQIESSGDGNLWKKIIQGQPIFRQPSGASQLRLAVPTATYRWLRLTVDDQRSQPVPFTGARVHAAASEPTPSESVPVTITERHENPGETRLTLNLGAANLDIASLHLETAEPLFTRQVTLAVPQVSEDSIHEQTLAHDTIYRVALDGQISVADLSVSLESQVRSRELFLLIKNQDSPPLSITAVRAERRPVYLVFFARQAGAHHLLTGNARCAAPRYDLASLSVNFKATAVTPFKLPPLADNPNYHAPEVLPGVQQNGTALDVSAWKFRKAVKPARTGAQQLELDLDVLAHAQGSFQDLRLVREGRQVPYILERTSITRTLAPTVAVANDPKDPKRTCWKVKLPQANLPITRLSCTTRSTLFERTVVLYEEVADERGEKSHRHLGSATWVQTPDRNGKELALTFDSQPVTDLLFLTTDNGDNPPIELEKFQLFHPATRILFKAQADNALFLYYHNPQVAPPRYDLSLVASQLLAADKAPAALASEEQLKKSSWAEGRTPGKGGVVFWGILALVVVGLLVVISRLLPKATQPTE
jgi:hypothetical protein